MKHLDLFSGIGGFAMAVDEVFSGDVVEHIFCEIDPFCQAILKKHWKGATIYGDIRGLTTDTTSERPIQCKYEEQPRYEKGLFEGYKRTRCDLLTGGFPCQPFSQAGKRKGTSDNRFLWPEMLRVIREFKPTWVIAENVRGIITIEQGMVFEQVCLDLEGEGYEVQPFIIPAVAVNAPHRRDRVWFVAHRKGERIRGRAGQECGVQKRFVQPDEREGREVRSEGEGCVSHAPNTTSVGRKNSGRLFSGICQSQEGDRQGESFRDCGGQSWSRSWLEVAAELCGVDDGLPADMDGVAISKSRHRIERLKALGNAIVPQVAVEILRAIRMAELVESL